MGFEGPPREVEAGFGKGARNRALQADQLRSGFCIELPDIAHIPLVRLLRPAAGGAEGELAGKRPGDAVNRLFDVLNPVFVDLAEEGKGHMQVLVGHEGTGFGHGAQAVAGGGHLRCGGCAGIETLGDEQPHGGLLMRH